MKNILLLILMFCSGASVYATHSGYPNEEYAGRDGIVEILTIVDGNGAFIDQDMVYTDEWTDFLEEAGNRVSQQPYYKIVPAFHQWQATRMDLKEAG